MGVWRDFRNGVYNLLLGLKVTAECLPHRAVTMQYPEEKWEEMPEGSRGIVVLLSDNETGQLNCTACLLCQKACPTAAIAITRDRGEDKKWFATSFTVDNTICCFCGLCEEACNFTAIKMAKKYEFSVYDQSELVFDMIKLQEIGRDVPYTPKPKKKAAPKPAPDARKADEGAEKPREPRSGAESGAQAPSGDLFDGAGKEPAAKPKPSPNSEPQDRGRSAEDESEAKE